MGKCQVLKKNHPLPPQVLELQLFDSSLAIPVVPEVHVRWSDIWEQLHLRSIVVASPLAHEDPKLYLSKPL